jgi:hypothetical protein
MAGPFGRNQCSRDAMEFAAGIDRGRAGTDGSMRGWRMVALILAKYGKQRNASRGFAFVTPVVGSHGVDRLRSRRLRRRWWNMVFSGQAGDDGCRRPGLEIHATTRSVHRLSRCFAKRSSMQQSSELQPRHPYEFRLQTWNCGRVLDQSDMFAYCPGIPNDD